MCLNASAFSEIITVWKLFSMQTSCYKGTPRRKKTTTKIQCYPFFSRWMQNWEWSLMRKRFWIAFEGNRLGKESGTKFVGSKLLCAWTHQWNIGSSFHASRLPVVRVRSGKIKMQFDWTRHFFFSQVNAEFKLPRSCRWNQMSVLKPTGTACFNCPECPAGQGLVPQCGSRITADVSVECVHCQTGEGYSYKRDISSCKPCTICDSNEQTISLCTASKNAVCGKCKSG